MDAATLLVAAGLAVLGAVLASFAAATGGRLATGESLRGRSHCACGRVLEPSELVPVVSYLTRRGRAPCCGARIDPALPVGEVVGAAVPAVVCVVAGPAWGVTALAVTTLGIGLDAARRARRRPPTREPG